MRRSVQRALWSAAIAAAGSCAGTPTARAASYTWVPAAAGTTLVWDAAANWNPNSAYPNAVGDVANLSIPLAGNQTITYPTVTVGSLTHGDAGNTYTQKLQAGTGASLTFDNGGAGAALTYVAHKTDSIGAVIANDDLSVTLSDPVTGTFLYTVAGINAGTTHDITVNTHWDDTAGGGLVVINGASAARLLTVTPGSKLRLYADFQGDLTVAAGAFLQSNGNNQLPQTALITHNGDWNMMSGAQRAGGLAGSGNFVGNAAGGVEVFGLPGNAAADFSGLLGTDPTTYTTTPYYSHLGTFKVHGGVQRLSGSAPNFTKDVTVDGGRLELNKSAGVNAIGGDAAFAALSITGGEVRLLQANQAPDTGNLSLGGGTFNANGLSETMAILSSSGSSAIDFGNGASTLTFASAGTIAGALELLNWTSGSDHLVFTDTTGLDLSNVRFFDGTTQYFPQLSGNEVVPGAPVPEPASLSLLAMGGLALLRRRRA